MRHGKSVRRSLSRVANFCDCSVAPESKNGLLVGRFVVTIRIK